MFSSTVAISNVHIHPFGVADAEARILKETLGLLKEKLEESLGFSRENLGFLKKKL